MPLYVKYKICRRCSSSLLVILGRWRWSILNHCLPSLKNDGLYVDSDAEEKPFSLNDPVRKRKPFAEKFAWENLAVSNENELDNQKEVPVEGDASHIGQLDLRVGCIVKVYPHQADDNLFIELIDLGTYDEQRLFATTLAPWYSNKKELINSKVVVCCNVHPLDTREIGSRSGMMLVASKYTDDKGTLLEICQVTEGDPGARVYVDGFPNEPFPTSDEDIFHFVLPDLRVDNDGMVLYKDLPLKVENTENGEVCTKSFSNCKVILD